MYSSAHERHFGSGVTRPDSYVRLQFLLSFRAAAHGRRVTDRIIGRYQCELDDKIRQPKDHGLTKEAVVETLTSLNLNLLHCDAI